MSYSYERINRCCGVDTLQINHCYNKFNFVLTPTRILFGILMYKTIGKTYNNMRVSTSRFNALYKNNKIELANIVEEIMKYYIDEDIFFTRVVAEDDSTFIDIPLEHEKLYPELTKKVSDAIEKYNHAYIQAKKR